MTVPPVVDVDWNVPEVTHPHPPVWPEVLGVAPTCGLFVPKARAVSEVTPLIGVPPPVPQFTSQVCRGGIPPPVIRKVAEIHCPLFTLTGLFRTIVEKEAEEIVIDSVSCIV